MKFFAVAVASFIGAAVAVANPGADHTIYSTQVVTVTSCPPEVPVCPGEQTTYVPVPTTPPAPTYGNGTIPCPTETAVPPPPVCPGDDACPPVCPGEDACPPPPPAGTGGPAPPANTTAPGVPAPPPFESGANTIGASFLALAGAAVLAMLA